MELIEKYGTAHYIKIDLEEYDHIVLNRILHNNIKFNYISAEIKRLTIFIYFQNLRRIAHLN